MFLQLVRSMDERMRGREPERRPRATDDHPAPPTNARLFACSGGALAWYCSCCLWPVRRSAPVARACALLGWFTFIHWSAAAQQAVFTPFELAFLDVPHNRDDRRFVGLAVINRLIDGAPFHPSRMAVHPRGVFPLPFALRLRPTLPPTHHAATPTDYCACALCLRLRCPPHRQRYSAWTW